MKRISLPLFATLMLTACGSGEQDGVGGVSAGEARALNAAAARLDAQAGAAHTDAPGLNPAATAAARADRKRIAPQPGNPQNQP